MRERGGEEGEEGREERGEREREGGGGRGKPPAGLMTSPPASLRLPPPLLPLLLPLLCTGQATTETSTCDQPIPEPLPPPEPPPLLDNECEDVDAGCARWASEGECAKNPGFMKIECAHSCNTCSFRDYKKRCRRDPAHTPAMRELHPQLGLDAWMEHAAAQEQYAPRVLSRDPWLIVFDEFLDGNDIAALRAAFDTRKLERSSNVGRMNALGRYEKSIDSSRTSENSWCDGDCARLPGVSSISQRIGNLTGCSELNSEFLQMLRYEHGQYYKVHHDFIPSHLDFPFGPRMLTLFLYLSDVEEGGTTDFPRLSLSVEPKAGRAVLWLSLIHI